MFPTIIDILYFRYSIICGIPHIVWHENKLKEDINCAYVCALGEGTMFSQVHPAFLLQCDRSIPFLMQRFKFLHVVVKLHRKRKKEKYCNKNICCGVDEYKQGI